MGHTGTYIDPCLILLVPDLETIDLVLKEHGDGTEIRVGSNAASEFLIRICRLRWVVEHSHCGDRTVHELAEVALLEIERQSKYSHQVGGQRQS